MSDYRTTYGKIAGNNQSTKRSTRASVTFHRPQSTRSQSGWFIKPVLATIEPA